MVKSKLTTESRYRYLFQILLVEEEMFKEVSKELTKTFNAIGGEGELQIKSTFGIGTVAITAPASLNVELAKVKAILKKSTEDVYPGMSVVIKHISTMRVEENNED